MTYQSDEENANEQQTEEEQDIGFDYHYLLAALGLVANRNSAAEKWRVK